jgi:hypothetical protein
MKGGLFPPSFVSTRCEGMQPWTSRASGTRFLIVIFYNESGGFIGFVLTF